MLTHAAERLSVLQSVTITLHGSSYTSPTNRSLILFSGIKKKNIHPKVFDFYNLKYLVISLR